MPDVFESVYGQPQVRDFLRATVSSARIGHTYLFTGPAGSNKTTAAYAFAQAIVCDQGGCGECDTCRRVKRRNHPDVRYLCPEGAAGYKVEQIRELISDVSLAPIRGAHKVYIVDRADLLGVQAANAFLKTLEEPPDDVVLILLGRTSDSVLPTIVSRCQVVPFRQIPTKEGAGIVAQNAGVSLEDAMVAIEACGGSLSKGLEFVRSSERMAFRRRVIEILDSLRVADDLDVLDFAVELLASAKAPLDVVRANQEKELEANSDFLAASAIRRIEQRNKNALSAATGVYLHQIMNIIRSWLRDVMMAAAGTGSLVINRDAEAGIARAAASVEVAEVVHALTAVDEADRCIAYNVSPETCIDVLLFDIREALYDTRSVS